MANPIGGSQRDTDTRLAAHAQKLRAMYRSIYLFVPLVFLGAGAGAAVGPVWNGALRTPAPHLIAIGLAAISIAAIAGAIWLQWRNRLPSESVSLLRPRPNSKGAFLLGEVSRDQQHMTIVVNSFLVVLLSLTGFGGGRWSLLVLGPLIYLGAAVLITTFRQARSAKQDEFFTATRGRATQIGFWTALSVLSALLGAGFFVDVVRFLPLALATTIAVPCLSFVALSAGGDRDE